jgi:hypothetical protein
VVCAFADRWPPEGCTPVGTEEITETRPPPRGMMTEALRRLRAGTCTPTKSKKTKSKNKQKPKDQEQGQ